MLFYPTGMYALSVSRFWRWWKTKEGTLRNRNFFVEGVSERGWSGITSLLKPSSAFLINKKQKFQNLDTDNRQVPSYSYLHATLWLSGLPAESLKGFPRSTDILWQGGWDKNFDAYTVPFLLNLYQCFCIFCLFQKNFLRSLTPFVAIW